MINYKQHRNEMFYRTARQKTVGFGFKEYVEKAVQGGCKNGLLICGNCQEKYGANHTQVRIGNRYCMRLPYIHELLLDPTSWEAVAKVEGWITPVTEEDRKRGTTLRRGHIVKMHQFLDALIEQV